MKDFKKSDSKMKNKDWDEKLKKYPKPWTQETHDQYLKDMGMTEEEHDEWHKKQEENE